MSYTGIAREILQELKLIREDVSALRRIVEDPEIVSLVNKLADDEKQKLKEKYAANKPKPDYGGAPRMGDT